MSRLNELERVVGTDWPWFGQYGDDLLEELNKLNIPPMQPKQQQKKPEKRTVQDIEEPRELQEQPATKKKRGQKQVAATPARNPTPTAVNPLPPPHVTLAPASTPHPYRYTTPQYYTTPQHLTYKPYAFLQHPYGMHLPPPFYSYFHTPTQAPVPNSPPSSHVALQNSNLPSSSTAGAQNAANT